MRIRQPAGCRALRSHERHAERQFIVKQSGAASQGSQYDDSVLSDDGAADGRKDGTGRPPRYTSRGAALHALLEEVVRLPRRAPGALVGRPALLLALASRPPTTVAALARSDALPAATRQGVQRLVDALADEGLVERVPNPRHRRAPRVRLTAAGRRAAAAAGADRAARMNALSRDLEPEALREAARLLHRLRTRLAGAGVPGTAGGHGSVGPEAPGASGPPPGRPEG